MSEDIQLQVVTVRERLLGLPREQKRVLQMVVDLVLIWLALWLAFYIRLDDVSKVEPFSGHAWLFMLAPFVSLPIFTRYGLYRAVMRYIGNQALVAIGRAVTLSTMLLGLA